VSPASGAVATVTVTPDSTSVAVGGSVQFAAQGYDASGKAASTTFTWSSSNTAVATVSATGSATGVAAGTALIRATAANGIFKESKLVVAAAGGGGGGGSAITVRFLDVGQGDATYITNGTSKVIIDGGPDTVRFGKLLDSLGLNGQTIDLVVLSHEHYDHHSGLLELFRSSRNITVRYFEENQNVYSNAQLQRLRDSISARAARGVLIYRDTDDPCATGKPLCTFTLNGGAKIHVLKPNPAGTTPNNRSAAEKIVGPDSASFTMWLAGDAEQEEIGWFLGASGYTTNPGMKVSVMKADHHGSCNGVTNAYVNALNPARVLAGVGATNSYGHMHTQAKSLFTAHAKPWYRTDGNGTVVVSSPGTVGGGYTVTVQKGSSSMSGAGDASSSQTQCNPIP
jgi:competence protein ComEC